jgi:CubicO group peptidase (beta-lactamase class C family)
LDEPQEEQSPLSLTHRANADADMARVDEAIWAEMRQQKVPGVALGIVHKGEVFAAKGYGVANAELAVPVTAQTIFQSGSVGKQFTATAVMLQVEAGKLALDDSITLYFTDAPPSWRAIKVRNLLSHTSGIPDYESCSGVSRQNAVIDYRRDYAEDDLARIAYDMPLLFAPGSRWRYSNTGYVLLGILVRKVSGQFYGDVLSERVFTPLGMKTARIVSEADIVPHRAAGYRLEGGQLKNHDWVSRSINSTADGSLYLSMLDYIAWDRGLRAHAVLKPESWAQIYTPIKLTSGKTYPYGFGWDVELSRGQPWYHHGGAWQGFKTYISRYLSDDLTIVLLTNLADANPERFVDIVARVLDPGLPQIEPSTPIPDADPSVAARIRTLLAKAADGKLQPNDAPFLAAADFADQAKEYKQMLHPLGRLERLDLLSRRELGDDRASTFAAVYPDRALRVHVEIAPDGRISELRMRPIEQPGGRRA